MIHDAFHIPLWLWGVTIVVVLAVVAADVFLPRAAVAASRAARGGVVTAVVVALGALFGLALAAAVGAKASSQFYAGWLTEYSLSLDNLFVFVLLIGRSGVAPSYEAGPAGRDRPRPGAAGRVYRRGCDGPEPLRLGAVHLRRDPASHRGAAGYGPGRRPARRPPGPSYRDRNSCASG